MIPGWEYEDIQSQLDEQNLAERRELNEARVELNDQDEYWYPDARG